MCIKRFTSQRSGTPAYIGFPRILNAILIQKYY
nr:MAG TPA: hypothetical protein [Caudoviricetes sp.]